MLSSLVAHEVGARVHAFDYDPTSVACTEEVKQRFGCESAEWRCERGSVLDETYLASLGRFDWVYSWGVLHHTGHMWQALDGLLPLVDDNGYVFIALYNDQGWIGRYWRFVKRTYNGGVWRRRFVVGCHLPYLFVARWLLRAMTGRLAYERGMSLWRDMLDWLGGYPFEVATPDEVIDFVEGRRFRLRASKICGRRHGCNEFVLQLTKG